jgi:asparagine synthase (glutamine-hydrolysing)
MTDTYDVGYLAELLTQDFRMREHTVYTGVTQLSAGSTLTVRDGHLIIQAYWSVADFEAERRAKISEADAIATCRDLLITSIRLRLDPGGRNWSQLSGGIDSSAVVSIVQWLAEQGSVPHGLDGTLTFVIGSQTASDERVFSDEVVKRWGIRNDVVVDAPMWFDDTDDAGIPLPDQPLLTLIHAPIDGRFRAILREAGARVLLTGWGSDQLFTGGPIYFADRLVQGQVSQVLGELAHRAALERGSFWKLAFDNLVKPYIPVEVRRFVRPSQSELPTWLRKDTLQRVGSTKQPDSVSEGRIGRKYDHWHASGIADAQRAEETRALAEVVSVRHPFLYRPLVEFALRLPAELCARPHSKKWVLRQAVKGILPEVVRTRVGKGGGGDSFVRMFAQQRAFIKQLAHDPILAELGLIDARRFMTAVDECSNSRTSKQAIWGEVMKTLIVEAWLQVRSGRWPHGFAMPRIPVIPQQDTHQLTVTQRRFV